VIPIHAITVWSHTKAAQFNNTVAHPKPLSSFQVAISPLLRSPITCQPIV